METPKLTQTERLILANQYRLLAATDEHDSDGYNNKAEIVENGYTGLYSRLFEHISDEVDERITQETRDILSMFRIINSSINSLKPAEKDQLDSTGLEFEGFDGNHDSHYSQALFMVDKLKIFLEANKYDLNSHSRDSLPLYLRKLAVYKQLYDAGKLLKLPALQQIAAVK